MRDFRATDQDALRALVLAGLRERWGDVYDESFNRDLDDIEGNYIQHGAQIVVVEEDGALVATGTLLAEGRLVRMSVAHTHRRRGLARSVVDELVDRARRRGDTELHVRTDTPWDSALALYRSCGFVEVGRDDVDTHFVVRLTE